MTTDDDEEDSTNGAEADPDEVPPPKIIKIEDYADVDSPYESLDGAILDRPDAVAAYRLDAESISSTDGEGVLVGDSVADLTRTIVELGGGHGQVRVQSIGFRNSMDVVFITTSEIEATLEGPQSPELRAAQLLKRVLASRDVETLLALLKNADEALAKALESLLKLLYENRATIDLQTPRSPPIRVVPERAMALYTTLREQSVLSPDHVTLPGRLVGAISDTRDFKLRLDEQWRGRRVIEGKFAEDLGPAVERFFNQQVMAGLAFVEERRGVRSPHFNFTLESLRAPQLPQRLPEV